MSVDIDFTNFNNPNVFQAERELQSTQGATSLSIKCPHCQHLGQFAAVGNQQVQYQKSVKNPFNQTNVVRQLSGAIRVCPNMECRGLVFVISSNGKILEINPPATLDFTLENLPLSCQTILVEAIACYTAKAYKASAMMVRRLLEEICKLNKAEGNNLHEKLLALKKLVILPEVLFEAMSELKSLGNDAAHVEARAYDNIGKDEAADSIELAKEILKAIYQLQGLVGRLQKRKSQPA